jgi:hypothetical protein
MAAHSIRMVNDPFPKPANLWFRNGGCVKARQFLPELRINRKFTPNQIAGVFREFSPN